MKGNLRMSSVKGGNGAKCECQYQNVPNNTESLLKVEVGSVL